MAASLISITGLPAAGKTTLAAALARDLGGRALHEDYKSNPFLPRAYTGDAAAALPSQIYYLMSRVTQLSHWAWDDKALVVSDYGFCQDRIYARNTLTDAEWNVYAPLADSLASRVHPPSVLVHLEASSAVLLTRIAKRGRDFERSIDEEFLSTMRRAYNDLEELVTCPVIRINCNEADLRTAGSRTELIEKIREKL